MFITRTLTTLSLSVVALLASSQFAQAQPGNNLFRKVSNVQVQRGGQNGYNKTRISYQQKRSGYGNPGYGNPGYGNPGYGNPGYGKPGYGKPGYGKPGYGNPGYGNPGCHREICPPPVRRCVYCVYYLDCHHHWKLYGKFSSRWSADEAQRRLRYQGHRTYTQVKHIGGGYPGPVAYNR